MANDGATQEHCISIIVPCWCDAAEAVRASRKWSTHPAVKEIVLAGVKGNEPQIADVPNVRWCASPRPSRGEQMNLGAQCAAAATLLFHHVDSELTHAHFDSMVRSLHDPQIIGGGFYRAFDERHPSLRWLENLERLHSRVFGAIYGDQSVFVRREVFLKLGGFAAIPLMEDVEFSKRLRRAGKTALLDPPMRSSPRRQIEQGAWRVTLRNLFFLVAYRVGMSPHQLHAWYYEVSGEGMQPRGTERPSPAAEHISVLE